MKFSDIQDYLLYQFKSENELLKSIEEISLKFTRSREHIGDYLNDPRLVSAYSAFYLLTNIPKLKEVLKWLPDVFRDEFLKSDLVDLGAGPGTFSFAWKELGGTGEVFQIETSKLMREQAKKIWQGMYSAKLSQGSRWEWKSENKKTLLFGHSANEMGEKVALDYIREIDPDFIFFIEPGTKDFFSKMLPLRKELSKHFEILYPCPDKSACPMEGTEEWCHQFIHVKQDPEVERFSQMMKLDRKLLPLTVQVFAKSGLGPRPQERIVRVLPETKFSLEWEVCHQNELMHYQVMKRDLSKAEVKELGAILSGEGVETEVLKNLEKSKRVKFIKRVK